MNTTELKQILRQHNEWLMDDRKGKRADLSGANLSATGLAGVNLSRADLSGADLSKASLYRANLSKANLSGANLLGACLHDANLSEANLSGANLSGADLINSNLYRTNLTGAILRQTYLHKADMDETILPYPVYWAQLGPHRITTNANFIHIGCHYETIDYWLNTFQSQGENLGLKKEHYMDYMAFIKWYANKYRNNPELFKGEIK